MAVFEAEKGSGLNDTREHISPWIGFFSATTWAFLLSHNFPYDWHFIRVL